MLRKVCRVTLLAALFVALGQTCAHAQGPVAERTEPEWRLGPLTLGADVAVTSAFVWRGFVLHDGACLQPDVWIKVSDLTFTSWLNIRGSIPDDSHVSEHDFVIDYSRDVGRVTLSSGWTNYQFFGLENGRTNEFYAGVSTNVPLQPGVVVYHDVQQGDGSYISLSAGQEWPMGRLATGGAQVALGYNRHMYMDGAGFSDVAITLKVSVPVPSARLTLEPTLTYSHSLMPEQFPSRLFGGLSVAFK